MKAQLIEKMVEWVAFNDEPTDLDVNSVKDYLTVCLIADTLGIRKEGVAKMVVELRKEHKK